MGIDLGSLYTSIFQQGPQMGMPGGVPGGIPGQNPYAAPPGAIQMGSPAAYAAIGSGAMGTPGDPLGGWGHGGANVQPPRRPGFGDMTGLDWTMAGVGLLTDIGTWWEQRAQRKEQERQFNELMAERERERADEERRRQQMGASWARAVARGGNAPPSGRRY